MIDIEIHIIHAEIFQTGVNHLLDVLLSGDAGCDFLRRAGQEFGSHHHVVSFGEVLQRPAHILLAGAALIADCGIEKIDAELQPVLYDFAGVLLIQRPRVLSVFRIAESHTAHADPGYIQFRITKLCIFHVYLHSAAAEHPDSFFMIIIRQLCFSCLMPVMNKRRLITGIRLSVSRGLHCSQHGPMGRAGGRPVPEDGPRHASMNAVPPAARNETPSATAERRRNDDP